MVQGAKVGRALAPVAASPSVILILLCWLVGVLHHPRSGPVLVALAAPLGLLGPEHSPAVVAALGALASLRGARPARVGPDLLHPGLDGVVPFLHGVHQVHELIEVHLGLVSKVIDGPETGTTESDDKIFPNPPCGAWVGS